MKDLSDLSFFPWEWGHDLHNVFISLNINISRIFLLEVVWRTILLYLLVRFPLGLMVKCCLILPCIRVWWKLCSIVLSHDLILLILLISRVNFFDLPQTSIGCQLNESLDISIALPLMVYYCKNHMWLIWLVFMMPIGQGHLMIEEPLGHVVYYWEIVWFLGCLVNKRKVISHSSTESKYQALALVTVKILLLWSLLGELGIIRDFMPIVFCDNVNDQHLARNPIMHAPTKHITVDFDFVREQWLTRLFIFL